MGPPNTHELAPHKPAVVGYAWKHRAKERQEGCKFKVIFSYIVTSLGYMRPDLKNKTVKLTAINTVGNLSI